MSKISTIYRKRYLALLLGISCSVLLPKQGFCYKVGDLVVFPKASSGKSGHILIPGRIVKVESESVLTVVPDKYEQYLKQQAESNPSIQPDTCLIKTLADYNKSGVVEAWINGKPSALQRAREEFVTHWRATFISSMEGIDFTARKAIETAGETYDGEHIGWTLRPKDLNGPSNFLKSIQKKLKENTTLEPAQKSAALNYVALYDTYYKELKEAIDQEISQAEKKLKVSSN